MSAGSVRAGPDPHQARDRFLAGEPPAAAVRREVLASWRRSSMSGVDPDLEDLPYRGAVDLDSRLHAAANPVLQRLADHLADTGTAVLLADRNARIVTRWVSDPQLRRIMDRHHCAPGFSLEEEICGTNGLGSVVEERRPLWVVGHEHFAAWFIGFACYGAPIEHPLTGRLEGVLTLVCRSDQASPLMMPFVEETRDRIQERILAMAGTRDHRLIDAFAWSTRHCRRGVIALSKDLIITNPAASRVVDGVDHALLWEAAADAMSHRRPTRRTFGVPGGPIVSVEIRPVTDGDRIIGAVMEIEPPAAPRSTTARPRRVRVGGDPYGLAERVGGTSPQWAAVLRSAAAAIGQRYPLVLSGEPGTGKLFLATAIHEQDGDRGDLHVIDAALIPLQGLTAWSCRLRTLLRQRATVIVRQIETVALDQAKVVAALLDEADGGPARVIGLLTSGDEVSLPTAPHIDRLAVAHIHLPPLRERIDDIPELVHRMLARRAAGRLSVSPDALQALLRCPWPGNLRQLEQFVHLMSTTRPAGQITLDDVPEDVLRASGTRPSMLAQVERQAIIRALRIAGGNKKEASSQLGISRSTLYRKLNAHGLDLDRTVL